MAHRELYPSGLLLLIFGKKKSRIRLTRLFLFYSVGNTFYFFWARSFSRVSFKAAIFSSESLCFLRSRATTSGLAF